MTIELDDIYRDPDNHLDRIRELVEAYGADAVFENGEYNDQSLRDRTRFAVADILSSCVMVDCAFSEPSASKPTGCRRGLGAIGQQVWITPTHIMETARAMS